MLAAVTVMFCSVTFVSVVVTVKFCVVVTVVALVTFTVTVAVCGTVILVVVTVVFIIIMEDITHSAIVFSSLVQQLQHLKQFPT